MKRIEWQMAAVAVVLCSLAGAAGAQSSVPPKRTNKAGPALSGSGPAAAGAPRRFVTPADPAPGAGVYEAPAGQVLPEFPGLQPPGAPPYLGAACQPCCDTAGTWDGAFFVGADLLWIRPHFSEVIAFARGRQTASSFDVRGRDLDFDYEVSPRVFFGYRLGGGQGDLRFTYWHFDGETDASAGAAPGQFAVDPFGNVAGTVAVIDPRDARFGTVITGGDLLRTEGEVEMNVYDLEWTRPIVLQDCAWVLSWSAGVRIADVEQFYESVLSLGPATLARGDFAVDFVGAGPRVGFEARRSFGDGRFSVFARNHGSLLMGDYEVESSNTLSAPAPFRAAQSASMTRLVPVLETELGASWNAADSLRLSAGWLYQAWFDMGTSGGQFGGFFTGADDANIMSFDGLVLRAEVMF